MITSMQNKTVKELLKLKQKKYRKDYYLVETNHLVEEAIKAKQTDLIISTEPVDLGVENLVVSKEIMEKLASTKTPQPIMARCFIQKDKKLVDGKRYLILDYLQDPGNIGTLIRTAQFCQEQPCQFCLPFQAKLRFYRGFRSLHRHRCRP